MIIEKSVTTVTFGSLPSGCVFEFENRIFLKLMPNSSTAFNSVDMLTGMLTLCDEEGQVSACPDATVTNV
jgi:hypothetical protein